MPISVTREQWLRDTSVNGRIRSLALRSLDSAIGNYSRTRDEQAVKRAFGAWVADGHESWRTNPRNHTHIIQQLYNDLGFGVAFRSCLNRLVEAACLCRAGSRLLWVMEATILPSGAIKKVPTYPAKIWIDCGRQKLVDVDCANVAKLYSTVNALRTEVMGGNAPPDVARVLNTRRPHTEFGTQQTFAEWAAAAQANCAQAGSRDAIEWAKLICEKTGYDFSSYRGRVESAQALGRLEEDANTEASFQLRNKGELRLPAMKTLKDDMRLYMKETIRLNSGLAFTVLRREYGVLREKILADFCGGLPDDDLLTFEQAMQEARPVRR